MDKAGKGRRMSSRIAKAQHFREAGTFTAGICQKKEGTNRTHIAQQVLKHFEINFVYTRGGKRKL